MKRAGFLALALALALLASSALRAADPAAYGYRWPLALDPEAGALRLTLPLEVYAHVYDPELRDLEVVDAAGKAQPFGPIPGGGTDATPAPGPLRDVPWFALPARVPGDPGPSILLRIERAAGGQLRRIDASVPPATATASQRSDLLLDLSAHAGRVESLELEWAPGDDVSARFRVSASDDLVSWSTLVSQASVVELHQNGFDLVRRRIDVPVTSSPYLLLERSDTGAPLALERVRASVAAEAARVPLEWSTARTLGQVEKGVHEFRAPGPLRVERLDVELASPGSVARVSVLSRDRDDAAWVLRASLHAFRLGGASEATQEDVRIAPTRDRQWRVTSEPALDPAPVLELGFRADEFVLLASGPGPFALLGGSATARRDDYPMGVLVSELRSRQGPAWQMSQASLGGLETLRGEAALTPPAPPVPIGRWLLWAVLVAAAGLIAVFALRLVRSASGGAPPGA